MLMMIVAVVIGVLIAVVILQNPEIIGLIIRFVLIGAVVLIGLILVAWLLFTIWPSSSKAPSNHMATNMMRGIKYDDKVINIALLQLQQLTRNAPKKYLKRILGCKHKWQIRTI